MKFGATLDMMLAESLDKRLPHLITMLTAKKSKWKGDNPEEFIRSIAKFDPSGDSASYMPYIVRQVRFGNIALTEDGVRLKNTLTYFQNNSRKEAWPGHRDVSKYKNWRELERVVDDVKEERGELKSKREAEKDIKVLQKCGAFRLLISWVPLFLFRLLIDAPVHKCRK